MMDSTADEDFPPNPFRPGGQQQQPPQQQQQQMMPPQQQPPAMDMQQDDFFSSPAPIADPLSNPVPIQNNTMQGSMQGSMMQNNNTGNTMQAPPARKTWWQSCRACCTMQTYQQFFDIDTVDIKTRLMGSMLHFYQPDYFRTNVIGAERTDELKGPDLYGPFWVTMTVVFLVAVSVCLF